MRHLSCKCWHYPRPGHRGVSRFDARRSADVLRALLATGTRERASRSGEGRAELNANVGHRSRRHTSRSDSKAFSHAAPPCNIVPSAAQSPLALLANSAIGDCATENALAISQATGNPSGSFELPDAALSERSERPCVRRFRKIFVGDIHEIQWMITTSSWRSMPYASRTRNFILSINSRTSPAFSAPSLTMTLACSSET